MKELKLKLYQLGYKYDSIAPLNTIMFVKEMGLNHLKIIVSKDGEVLDGYVFSYNNRYENQRDINDLQKAFDLLNKHLEVLKDEL